jgi:hypothetical protein
VKHPLVPIAIIAAVSLAGMIAGLAGDGWEDRAAALGLIVSLAPILWALRRAKISRLIHEPAALGRAGFDVSVAA